MTIRKFLLPNSLFLILPFAFWLTVGLVVINHNVAPFGRVTLHWPNPRHPTVHFRWNEARVDSGGWWRGGVRLPAGQTLTFSVRLPRGFTTGKIVVTPDSETPGFYTLQAETLAGRPVIEVKNHDRVEWLSQLVLDVRWADLVARGREFSFTLKSTGADDINIRLVDVITSR